MTDRKVNINIAGDFVVNQHYTTDNIDGDLLALFHIADFNIVNLEAPLTDGGTPELKTGPHLRSDFSSAFSVLNGLKINVVTLANNHLRDFGAKGVLDTLKFCEDHQIKFVGGGKNKSEASRFLSLNTPQGLIAIINIAENEWASATNMSAGANGMDLIDDSFNIAQAKASHEFVFVIVHGGHEYYNLPSPRMQKQYRFYVDCGADLVVGHHSHCISGSETYKGTEIYYSLGNFLFTKKNTNDDWYQGLVLEIEIENYKLRTKLHGVKQDRNNYALSLNSGVDLDILNSRLQEYRNVIANQNELGERWNQYVEDRTNYYLDVLSPAMFVGNRYIRAILRKYRNRLFTRKGFAYLLNLIKCEAHADLSKEIIARYLK